MATAQTKSSGVPIDNATVQTVRDWLAQRYERRYRQKMAERLPVNLHFHASLHGIRESDRSSFIEVPAEEAGGQLRKVFQQTKGRLLLLGAPGAGKTMQLIQLAQSFLPPAPTSTHRRWPWIIQLIQNLFLPHSSDDLDSSDESSAMPVVLNLATWTSEYPTLLDWLKKSLPYELGTNEPLALKLLAHRRVILLLDGFDEMAQQHRVSFFEKMAEHLVAQPHQEFVISSRIQEYLEAAAEKTPPVVHQPVEVAALSIEQIREKLKWMEVGGEPAARRFLAALDTDPLLCVAAAKPFYFNCLQMLFALKPWSEWGFSATTQEGREAEVADHFIKQELKKCSDSDTQRWLVFLASRMEEREMVVFELRDLQYGWGEWSRREVMEVYWVGGISVGTVFGLVSMLVISLSVGLYMGLSIGLVIGIFLGLMFGLITIVFSGGTEVEYDILTRGRIQWSFRSLKSILFTFKKPVGIFLGVFVGLIGGLIGRIALGGLAGWLAGGSSALISVGLLNYIESESDYILQISHPYQRFTASAKNLHFSILQHWHLRHLLARKGLLPRRLVHFLNEMAPLEKNSRGEWPRRRFTTEQVYLMETDGATWRFRHRIIQEWFAARGESAPVVHDRGGPSVVDDRGTYPTEPNPSSIQFPEKNTAP